VHRRDIQDIAARLHADPLSATSATALPLRNPGAAGQRADLEEARAFNERVVNRALAWRGLHRRARHGFGKMRSCRRSWAERSDLMASLKRAIDPENLMNPEGRRP